MLASWVRAPVRSPTQGAARPRRRAYASTIPSGSSPQFPRSTCTFTMARASAKPPRRAAEDSVRSGRSAATTTASGPLSTWRPAIIGSSASERRPRPEEEGGAERGEAAHLGIALVEEVVHPEGEVQRLQPAVLVDGPERSADVHARVPAVVADLLRLELARDHVDLGEEREPADGLPGQAEVPAMLGLPVQPAVGPEIFAVGVRVVDRAHQITEDVDLAGGLDALGARAGHVDGRHEREGGDRHEADEVLELVVEVRQPEPDALTPEGLVEPGLPREALLRLEIRAGEGGEEEI